MKTEKFNLTWKDFENCTSNSFRGFMSRQEFVDVTLMCDDSSQIRAHKVLLSACSEFFKNILVKTSHQQHTVMYIDSVTHQELQNIISFMYFGETTITQEEFTNFMRAAQKLQIKGLSEQYCKQVPPSNTEKHLKRVNKFVLWKDASTSYHFYWLYINVFGSSDAREAGDQPTARFQCHWKIQYDRAKNTMIDHSKSLHKPTWLDFETLTVHVRS